MLIIREAQLQALQAERQRSFRRQLVCDLTKLYAQSGRELPPSTALAQIEQGINAAHRYDISSEEDIARFVQLVCVRWNGFGPETLPKPVMNILLAYRVPASVKLDRLEQHSSSK
jgi:hypothetical protein